MQSPFKKSTKNNLITMEFNPNCVKKLFLKRSYMRRESHLKKKQIVSRNCLIKKAEKILFSTWVYRFQRLIKQKLVAIRKKNSTRVPIRPFWTTIGKTFGSGCVNKKMFTWFFNVNIEVVTDNIFSYVVSLSCFSSRRGIYQ